jgi:hypothetical protein
MHIHCSSAWRTLWVALPLSVSACTSRPASDTPRTTGVVQQRSEAQRVTVLPHWPEDTIVVPGNSVDSAAVLQAVAWRAHIDSQIEEKRDLRLRLAALTADTQLVAVANANSWPDATAESFGVRTDQLGRVVNVYETPFSQSGDWNNEYTYYFDTLGTTLIFQRRSSFFSGCQEGGARETSVAYLGSRGRLLRRDYVLTAFDDTTRLDPKACTFDYRYDYSAYPTWTGFASATGLSKLFFDHAR